MFSFTSNAELDAEVEFRFACDNAEPAPSFSGLNRFRLQASVEATPDLVALAATASNDGIVQLNGGVGAFSVAAVNVGSTDWLTVQPVLPAGVPASAFVCETDPSTGQCINPTLPSTDATVLIAGFATPTFSVFINASAAIALDPVGNRVRLEFVDSTGTVRGSTGVALQYTP